MFSLIKLKASAAIKRSSFVGGNSTPNSPVEEATPPRTTDDFFNRLTRSLSILNSPRRSASGGSSSSFMKVTMQIEGCLESDPIRNTSSVESTEDCPIAGPPSLRTTLGEFVESSNQSQFNEGRHGEAEEEIEEIGVVAAVENVPNSEDELQDFMGMKTRLSETASSPQRTSPSRGSSRKLEFPSASTPRGGSVVDAEYSSSHVQPTIISASGLALPSDSDIFHGYTDSPRPDAPSSPTREVSESPFSGKPSLESKD